MKFRVAALAAFTGLAFAAPAHADEQYFGYTYSAEVLGKGQSEAEFWATDRRGTSGGHFDAQDYRIELEHGFTNRLTVAGYANLASHHIRGLDPDFEKTDRDFAFRGLSAEFKYNLLSPYKDGVGLTLYAEPAWSRIHGGGERGTELELEFKAILQKNFMDDRLIWASNLTFEPEWENEKEVDELTGVGEGAQARGLDRSYLPRRAGLVGGRRGPLCERLSGLDERPSPRDLCGVRRAGHSLWREEVVGDRNLSAAIIRKAQSGRKPGTR